MDFGDPVRRVFVENHRDVPCQLAPPHVLLVRALYNIRSEKDLRTRAFIFIFIRPMYCL